MTRVAVIGSGPASLAAVHAAHGLGASVTVYGPRTPSKLRGPVLLQRPIPGITLDHPDGYIRQQVIGGSILDYREKLYGDVNISINGDILAPGYHAWKMEETYAELWRRYSHRITFGLIKPEVVVYMAMVYDLVVNTAPANAMCVDPAHRFVSREVALTFESQPDALGEEQADNLIVFNAGPEQGWVRSSSVFGNRVTEWPPEVAPDGAHIIRKPISTDCDCNARVLRTGRFGAWKNETWVDTAYYTTREALL